MFFSSSSENPLKRLKKIEKLKSNFDYDYLTPWSLLAAIFFVAGVIRAGVKRAYKVNDIIYQHSNFKSNIDLTIDFVKSVFSKILGKETTQV